MRQAPAQEHLESVQRFRARHRELARPIAAHKRRDALAFPAVQIIANLRVDVVLTRCVGCGHIQCRRAARRRLPVGRIEVPGTTRRLVAVEQQTEPPAGIAVEVLQPAAVHARPPTA